MAKEEFFYRETQQVLSLLDEASQRSHSSRGPAFEDFLEMSVCALSGGQMEEQYLKVVRRYSAGEQGKRGVDSLAHMFSELVRIMEETRADILGDLFMGAITYGEHGQFYTPSHLCDLMARMNMTEEDTGKRIFDPCCGSGRMLLACADINRNNEFHGQDIDLRCVRMTAINLALRNLYGYVIWGNSLADEQRMVYRTGFNGKGFIAEVPIEQRPEMPPAPPMPTNTPAVKDITPTQLLLF